MRAGQKMLDNNSMFLEHTRDTMGIAFTSRTWTLLPGSFAWLRML